MAHAHCPCLFSDSLLVLLNDAGGSGLCLRSDLALSWPICLSVCLFDTLLVVLYPRGSGQRKRKGTSDKNPETTEKRRWLVGIIVNIDCPALSI